MIPKTAIVPALAVFLATVLWAGEPGDGKAGSAQPPPAADTPAASETPKLGNWWEKNARKLEPFPTRWLFHTDCTFSYMNASGNTSGSTFDTTANAEIRKGSLTSHTFAQVSRKSIGYGSSQGSVDYTERTLREQVDFDPARYITFFAAIEDYRNTLIFIDKRLLVYAGVGGRVFRNERSEVVLNGGLGHADFTFDRHQVSLINPRQFGAIDTSPSSGGAVATGTWRWKPSPRFHFTEDVSYLKYFKSSLAYRWTINLSGDIPIDQRFSFNLTYRVKKETNPILEALGVLPLDRTLLVGIKVSI